MNAKAELKYPYEYLAAEVYFAVRLAQIEHTPMPQSLSNYNALYREITNGPWDESQSHPLWQELLKRVGNRQDPKEIADIVFKLYCEQSYSIFEPESAPEGTTRFGPFGLDYSEYNQERDTVRLHYMPQRQAKSELASDRFDELKAHFRDLLVFAREQYPDVTNFTCSTWVNAIPNLRRLFPQSFNDAMVDIGASSYLGLWGQFMKSDGTGNQERFHEFIEKLRHANSLDEAVDAFPYKVLEGVGPLSEFYKEYNIA